jgi:ribonuclease HI
LSGKTFKFRLDPFSSIFTSEVLALFKALEAVFNLPLGKFLLCTDSLSAIQRLQSPDFTHPLILELCTTSHTLSKQYFKRKLAWIPGHVGISGNEVACAAASDATTQGSLVPGVLSWDFNTALRRCILAK